MPPAKYANTEAGFLVCHGGLGMTDGKNSVPAKPRPPTRSADTGMAFLTIVEIVC